MPCRLTFWGFLTIGLWASACLPNARAEWPADGECAGLRREMTRALDAGEFPQAATAGTTLFAHCSLDNDDWDPLSAQLGAALRQSDRDDEALGVIDRCLARTARPARCLLERGFLLRKLGRPAAAQQAFQAAQRYGATAEDLPADQRTDRKIQAAEARAPRPPVQGDRAGSGFFVNQAGDIITNAHVVAGCGHVETSDRKPLTVLGRDANIDIAVLHADLVPANIATLRVAPAPRVGEDVLAFGFPLPGLLSTEGNVTIGILSATRGVADDPHVFQMTAPVQSGNSGGPLVDASGNVVGVVVSKLDVKAVSQRTGDVPQNVNFAVKAAEVTAFLDRLHIPYSAGRLGDRKNAADLAEATEKFAVQILCFAN